MKQNDNNVIFLHGFKVDGDSARGWHSEMFKRLWQSGLTAQFHGVTWEGNIGFLDGRFNYHGNMVVASAIADYGMSVGGVTCCL